MSSVSSFLLQYFDRLAEAPGGIAKLRTLILQLAVQGKLGTQNPIDEPATKLVERMSKARKALPKAPKQSALPEEMAGELPSTWLWQPLCGLLREPSQNGYSQSADENPDGIPLLRISAGTSRTDGDVEEIDYKRTTLDADTKTKFALQTGDLLAVRFNGNLHFTGKVTIYRGKLGLLQIFPDKLIRLRVWNEFVVPEYVRLAMSAPMVRTAIESFCATTVGNVGISASDLVTVPIPLPPLAEQRRIVAKVEALMRLCDALEAAQRERETVRTRLRTSALHRLTAPDTDSKSPAFVLQHLSELTSTPDDLEDIRYFIRQLGVQGQLLRQSQSERPALEKSLSEADPELPITPEKWRWATVGDVGEQRLGKMLDQQKNKGIPKRYLRNINVRWFDFDLSNVLEMKFEDSELEEFTLKRGDVMICEGGYPGRAAVWDEREADIYFQKAIHRVRFSKAVDPYFFVLRIRSDYDSGHLASYFTGTGIQHFTGRGLASYKIPLPPLAEQRRIVAKVDELMAVLDALEAALTSARTTGEYLLTSTIARLSLPRADRTREEFIAAEAAAPYGGVLHGIGNSG